VQCSAVQCSAAQRSAVQCSNSASELRSAVLFDCVRHSARATAQVMADVVGGCASISTADSQLMSAIAVDGKPREAPPSNPKATG
jgi:hypothetical protein